MRKLLAGVSAIAVSTAIAGTLAWSVNMPLFTGPTISEPSQVLSSINALVQAINFGTTGNIGFIPGAVANNNATTLQTFAITTIPTGQFTSAGQGIRATCAGSSSTVPLASAGTYILQIGVGASTAVVSSTAIVSGQNWRLQLTWEPTSTPVTATNVFFGGSSVGTNAGASTVFTENSGTDTNALDNNFNNSIPVRCMYVNAASQPAGTATMNDFIVEQIK